MAEASIAAPLLSDSAQALKILVIRADRLGDVVLSTPVFEVIKRHYPRSKLTVLVRESVAPLLKGLSSVDEVFVYDPEGKHAGVKGFFRLVGEIQKGGYRIAVTLQSQWRLAAAVFFARVRYRVGPLSKLHSFFFYNRGVRQRRSHVEMHEADYNLQLLRRLGIRVGTRNVPTRIQVSDQARESALGWLKERGWVPEKGGPLIAVHPGMGGSALNWPETHYVELVRALVKEGRQLLLTGGPEESGLLNRIQEALGSLRAKVIVYGGPEVGPIDQCAALYSWASLVIAPSTGPLHVAVALGKPVVTFYPPIRVQSAVRWGPYLREETRASVLVPEVYCGEDFSCRGHLCNYFPCMKSLTVTQALEQVNRQLARSSESPDSSQSLNSTPSKEPKS